MRHESSAAFAAEGWAKVTREPGVCALTAGPGVTNGISALASAQANHSPLLALGGRAPQMRWGQGSLKEIDHIPLVRPLTKLAATAQSTAEIPTLIDDAFACALAPHSGPTFIDLPLDYVFMEAAVDEPHDSDGAKRRPAAGRADGQALERAAKLLREAERPVIMAGTNLYSGHGEGALRELIEALRIPVFLNGLARGCVPADHELCFSRARGHGLKEADVALVIGVPMDFRLGFGGSLGDETEIVAIDVAEPERAHPRRVTAELYGAPPRRCGGCVTRPARARWTASRGSLPCASLKRSDARRSAPRWPTTAPRCTRCACTGSWATCSTRTAIVIGDGGDFVSYAGRVLDRYEPGCWLDPGPFGCLGAGPGYALAAKLARPDRQVVLLLGDGAFGFSGLEYDTLARYGVNVVGVMGNNGIWGLEKHPMEFLYGYSVAAELRPETRYDQVVEALGGYGEIVLLPGDLRGALGRAFEAGRPALVNVLTDPSVAPPLAFQWADVRASDRRRRPHEAAVVAISPV